MAIILIAGLGVIGNIASIFLLATSKMWMKPTFTSLLVWLAVLDSLFLVLVVLVFSLPELSLTYKLRVFPHMLSSLLPLAAITLTASVYTVVAVVLERYLHLASGFCGPDVNTVGILIW